jgi:hypothetical protein
MRQPPTAGFRCVWDVLRERSRPLFVGEMAESPRVLVHEIDEAVGCPISDRPVDDHLDVESLA